MTKIIIAGVVLAAGFAWGDAASIIAARTTAEQTRGAGKRGWIAYQAERNAYFPAQDRTRVEAIAATLPPTAVLPGDPRTNRAAWDAFAATPDGQQKICAAEQALTRETPPVTTNLYYEMTRTGNRDVYLPHQLAINRLTALVYGECLENKGRFVSTLARVLETICAEPSWVAPYEGGTGDLRKPLHGIHYIDLTAASTAAHVAFAASYLRDKLPPATRAKVLDTLRGRIFETFLSDARRTGEKTPYHNWWMPDRFNWSAVCHNGCTTAILATEDDTHVRAEAIEVSERLMAPCFLNGFLADGYCEEGMGYWNYGYGNFLRLAALVKAVTGGKTDFCRAFPRAELVAGFGARYRMGKASSPLFADGNGTADPTVLALIHQNWPALYGAETAHFAPFRAAGLEAFAVLNFGPYRFHPTSGEMAQTLPPRDWFAAAQTLICRAGDLSFAIKGGTNGDRHNHNDAGSYLLTIGDTAAAGDPGNENYTGRTFSRRRYESKVLNSFAHPVPRIGGELQGTGPAFGARLVRTDFTDARDTIVYDLADAYPAKLPVTRLVRTAVCDRTTGEVTITDHAEFAAPTAFETPVIAYEKPFDGATKDECVIPCTAAKRALLVTIHATGGEWKTADEFVSNPHRTQPTRRAIAFTRPVTNVTVSVTYRVIRLTPQMEIPRPAPASVPRINGPRVFGVRPGNPVFWRMCVTGTEPLAINVTGLPPGTAYDPATRLVTGSVPAAGEYPFRVTARNAKGQATRDLLLKAGSTLALTPPMGWNSWNCWGQAVSDAKIRAAAHAMRTSGLADHGWSYIVTDDCWRTRPTTPESKANRPGWISDYPHMYGPARLADGTPATNSHFPDMKSLNAFIHAQGLHAGLYSVPGEIACCWTFGSWKYEATDAATWADWGVDLVKYDWCYGDSQWRDGTSPRQWQFKAYKLMGDLLARQKRDIVYNVCNYGRFQATEWARAAGGHYWRTNDDLKDTWPLLIRSINANLNLADAAGPGGWNDPDMLVVGPMRSNGYTTSRLTPNEQVTHLSLWAMMAAPLFIGCDLERLDRDPLALALLTNDEMIAIDQDELGKAGRPVRHTPEYDVWLRPLADGSWAVALFNRTWEPRTIGFNFASLGLPARLHFRDVWRQADEGTHSDRFEAEVFGHATRLYRIR